MAFIQGFAPAWTSPSFDVMHMNSLPSQCLVILQVPQFQLVL